MAKTEFPLGMPAAPPPPSPADHVTVPLYPAPFEEPVEPPPGLSIANSEVAIRNIRRGGRTIMEYADGYLTRKVWPTSLLDQITGAMADLQSWITYASTGLYNYDADQPGDDAAADSESQRRLISARMHRHRTAEVRELERVAKESP